jgi:hypothetical protein
MRVKLLTTGAFILGLVLVMAWPWILRQRPRPVGDVAPPRRAVGAFQVMFAGYVGVTVFSFMTSGCLAMLLMHNTREEFSRRAMENVRELVEGSMEDLRSRNKGNPGP